MTLKTVLIQKRYSIGLLLSCIMFLLPACNEKKSTSVNIDAKQYVELPAPELWQSDWSDKNIVVVQELAEPDNLHPTNGNSQTRSEIFLYIHGSLLRTNLRSGGIEPGICKSLPVISEDKLGLTFDLRENVKWDDGSSVTPEDVVFTVKAAKCPLTDNAAFKPYMDLVDRVEIIKNDPQKVKIIMKKVYVQNIAIWADYPILQRKLFDPSNALSKVSFEQLNDSSYNVNDNKEVVAWSSEFNAPGNGFNADNISGLGPYKVKEWQQGQLLVLEKKMNHWTNGSAYYAEAANPDEIIFKVNKDPVTQELGFLKQEFDVSTSISTRTLLKLLDDSMFNKNYHGNFVDVYGYTFMGLNTRPDEKNRSVALKDREVRRALAYLTPVDNIIKVVNRGVNKRVVGPVAKMKPSYNSTLTLIPFDVKTATSILDKAGWNSFDSDGIRMKTINGKKVRLEFELAFLSAVPEWKEMAILIADGMKQAGVKINLSGNELSVWLENGTTHNFDMMMGSWNTTSLPEDYSQLWSQKSWSDQGLNFVGFGDAASDALIDSIAITLDDNERNSMEYRMQEKIYNEQPYIFLYGLVRRCAVHRRFTGAELYSERPGILYNLMKVNVGQGVKAGVAP